MWGAPDGAYNTSKTDVAPESGIGWDWLDGSPGGVKYSKLQIKRDF